MRGVSRGFRAKEVKEAKEVKTLNSMTRNLIERTAYFISKEKPWQTPEQNWQEAKEKLGVKDVHLEDFKRIGARYL